MIGKPYTIDARVVPTTGNGYTSGGQQIRTFTVLAVDATAAARIVLSVLRQANPTAEFVTVTAWNIDGPSEFGVADSDDRYGNHAS